jgi:branched-chain amino acid transport system substrate-binding protein
MKKILATLAVLSCCGGAAAQTAPAGKPYVMGLIAEQSGPLSYYGMETTRAAEIVVKELNDQGGLMGRPVRLVERDSKSNVAEAVRQARDLLYSENVDILFHSINSAECVAVGGIAKQAQKIMFSNCANEDFTGKDGGPTLFRVPNITARTQAYAAVAYVQQNMPGNGKRVFTIAQDFAFGRGAIGLVRQRLTELDSTTQFVGEAWPKLTEASYAPYITAMIDAKPQVVYYFWGAGIPFWQQAASYDLPSKFAMVSSYWGGSDDLQSLPQQSIPTGAVMGGIPWYAVEGPENQAFIDAYQKAYGKKPFTAAYMEYITMQVFRAGVAKAGSLETDQLAKALEGLQVNTVVGPVTIRPFDHQGTTPLWTGKAAWDSKLGIGVLTDIIKLPTAKFLPSEDEIKKARL